MPLQIVSTVISGILFARFPTVEFVPTEYSFLVTSLTVVARNERESQLFALLLMRVLTNECSFGERVRGK